MEIGWKVKAIKGKYAGRQGVILNPRDVYGLFEDGKMPVLLEGIEEPQALGPWEVIRIPKRGSI